MPQSAGDLDPMSGFSALTRSWFESAFEAPTNAQLGAWASIHQGNNTLVVAPTGSGKTLAAFLAAIDSLANQTAPTVKRERCRVLYISPLKALAADVERNLRSPLVGLAREAQRAGQPVPEVSVGIRTGDTPANERRKQSTTPPDILITTPESLFLILTSQARESLRGVETVIIDEIHAVAGTKRGAHLAISLERLDALLAKPAQRIGLSATVEPVEEVAMFLGGAAPVRIVNPASQKEIVVEVVVPVEDLAAPSPIAPIDPHTEMLDDARPEQPSIWPHVENRIVDLIEEHTSTLVFANSRRLAERLTARINEIAAERAHLPLNRSSAPAELMAQAGSSAGAPPTLARAHHGSVSKEQRALIEDDLKAGRIPAVVATSSLELGIDMGAVDLVIQVEAPPSVASGLQRVGRAGHQVGEVSRAAIFPKHRGDLLAAAVVSQQMQARKLEATRMTRNALDVLAQQIIAMVSIDDGLEVDEVFTLLRKAAPYAALPRSAFDAVLDMLAGKYPAEGFSQLRPRLVWDRIENTLTQRPGAQRLAVTSGGTIPDRGLFGVFMVGEKASRVGELDEEMVYESRVGDVFALGATSWRIEDITHDRVLVSPAPGQPGKLPFWHGDALGRPFEVGKALGELNREIATATPDDASKHLSGIGLDALAAQNLVRYVHEQANATGSVPTDRTLVIEKFRDELGDWRVVLHSPFGARVHAPWALAISARVRELTGLDAAVMHADDGIVLRIPDTDDDATVAAAIDALFPDPDEITSLVTDALGGSALFASRFRECAARALLLPRRDPGRRTPLWQQRQRSASLLAVASQYPTFPIVLETVRECLQDVYDVPALTGLLREIRSRQIDVVTCTTPAPSPFARTLLFSYVATFLYEGDSPLAERRAAALALDPELLAELIGSVELRELLSIEAIADVEAQVSYVDPARHARTAEQAADLLRILGPLSGAEWERRGVRSEWLDELVRQRRAIAVRINNEPLIAAIEDAGRLRDCLGVALPVGIPDAFLEVTDDPLADLLARFARTHGPFQAQAVSDQYGLGIAVVNLTLARLEQRGQVVSGEFRPDGNGTEWCDAEVLKRIRRRSISALRQEIEPVPPAALGAFLPEWSGITAPRRGVDGVLHTIDLLAGAPLPASSLESMILPARVSDYAPALLDELMSAGEVVWCGRGRIAGSDGWISLAPADRADLLLPDPLPTNELELDTSAQSLLALLAGGGGWLAHELADRVEGDLGASDLSRALWSLLWSGQVTTDTLTPLRAFVAGAGPDGTASRRGRTPTARGATRSARLGRARMASRVGAPVTAGRWAARKLSSRTATERAAALANILLDRYGVVTRGAVTNEGVVGGFAGVYRVLSALEDAGNARRGYFIEGLGAAQFATAGAVDQLRARARHISDAQMSTGAGLPEATRMGSTARSRVLVLSACDPANPYGAALGWPASASDQPIGHRPGRKAGSIVVMRDGALVLYIERGGKSILGFAADDDVLSAAFTELARYVKIPGSGPLTVQRFNGVPVASSAAAGPMQSAGFTLTPSGMRIRPS